MESQTSVWLLWNTFWRACSCNSVWIFSMLVFPVHTLSILTDLFVRCPLFVVCSEMERIFFSEEMTMNWEVNLFFCYCFFFNFCFGFILSVCVYKKWPLKANAKTLKWTFNKDHMEKKWFAFWMIIGFSLLSDVLKLCCCALKRRQGAVERCLHLTWLEREAWGVKCWLQLTKAHKRCFLYLNILCESWDIRYWFTRQPLERTGNTAVLSQCWQVYWSHNGLCLYGYFFRCPFTLSLRPYSVSSTADGFVC